MVAIDVHPQVYVRRLCRRQVYACLALASAAILLLRLPEDLLNDFSWEHQVVFAMATTHWIVSIWEESRCGRFLAGGLDSKALPGVRDPGTLLQQAYMLHHTVAALTYISLLLLGSVSAVGTLGLLFELPVLLLNHRELALLSGPGSARGRWLSDKMAVSQHWCFTYAFFVAARGGPAMLYVYSLVWCTQQLESLGTAETFIYHSTAIFFSLMNYASLALLDAWARVDATAAALPPLEDEEGLDEEEPSFDNILEPLDPEAAPLQEVDPEVLSSKTGTDEVWLEIDGSVYNLTSYQDEHPGGRDVLRQWSGQNATDAFRKVCPMGQSTKEWAALCRYQVGPLRAPPTEYCIMEHPEEEAQVRRLLLAVFVTFFVAAFSLNAFLTRVRGALSTPDTTAVVGVDGFFELALPSLLLSTVVGFLATVSPFRRRLGDASFRKGNAGGVADWRSHAVALALLLQHLSLLVACGNGLKAVLGEEAPQGAELSAAAILVLELLFDFCNAQVSLQHFPSPFTGMALCAWSWQNRGLADRTASIFSTGIASPCLRALALSASSALLMRLAAGRCRSRAVASAQHGLWLCGVYGCLGACGACTLSPAASEQFQQLFAEPVFLACLLLFAGSASLVAQCAVLDTALKCSPRFACRCLGFLLALLGILTSGLASYRWLFAVGCLIHLKDLAKQNRLRLDEAARSGNFRSLDWHVLGAQAVWDASRLAVLGAIWRLTICKLQHVITFFLPKEMRVFACEVPVPTYGGKADMGIAAQFVPPKAKVKRRKPEFFVCNVGQIVESCLPDMQKTMNTLIDVWGEFQDPKLPGLCANVVAIFPSCYRQGLAKEINLSAWESGKDAYEWYVKSKGHRKALPGTWVGAAGLSTRRVS
eukprot:TRINITY_DN20221_c0_g2_i2.p1 TRINITY_DN20221_c0_g2~~TRINITY_DN20221_c0_g2_i2.p1  ORF type:complete len:920 (-),score=184.62 TRINITY_DN20221_c0_g2_i2:230-2860(-)